MSFDHILPPTPPKQPGENYHVWIAGPYKESVEKVLADLMVEAQSEDSTFRPDDLASEVLQVRRHLAIAPNESPGLCIDSERTVVYTDDGVPLFQPTHVVPGRIVNVWYLVWEKEDYVGICRLEPNASRKGFV